MITVQDVCDSLVASVPPRDSPALTLQEVRVYQVLGGLAGVRERDEDEGKFETLALVAKAHRSGFGRCAINVLRTFYAALGTCTEDEIGRAVAKASRLVPTPVTPCPGALPVASCPCDDCRWERSYKRACDDYRAPRALEVVRSTFGLQDTQTAADLYSDALLVTDSYCRRLVWSKKG